LLSSQIEFDFVINPNQITTKDFKTVNKESFAPVNKK